MKVIYDYNVFFVFDNLHSSKSFTICMCIGPVTAVHYSLDGRLYTTASKDGCIKVQSSLSLCNIDMHLAEQAWMSLTQVATLFVVYYTTT